jgi:hypothetical protein
MDDTSEDTEVENKMKTLIQYADLGKRQERRLKRNAINGTFLGIWTRSRLRISNLYMSTIHFVLIVR